MKIESARLHFQRLHMMPENLGQFLPRNAAETAIGADAEIRQLFSRRGDALAKPLHIMDGAQIDARAPGLQIGKRREIAVIGTVENRNVDPIDVAARMGGEGVRHGDRAA